MNPRDLPVHHPPQGVSLPSGQQAGSPDHSCGLQSGVWTCWLLSLQLRSARLQQCNYSPFFGWVKAPGGTMCLLVQTDPEQRGQGQLDKKVVWADSGRVRRWL